MPGIGQTISHFRLVEKIGQGGMGEVYLADDTTLDRKVALKFLPEAFTSDPERMARFEREAKLLASLPPPNIAGIHGLEQADGSRFLVLEYVEGETLQARLSKGDNVYPVWSPDGNRIVFARGEQGVYQLYQKPVNGAEEEKSVLKTSENKYPTSWSSDGRFLLYTAADPATYDRDIWVLPMPMRSESKPVHFLHTEFDESDAHFSQDMRWVAYVSNETGIDEINVCGFKASENASFEITGRWTISNGGGRGPRWRKDGKELYYRSPDGKIMSVKITGGNVFEAGTPTPLFRAPVDLLAQSNAYTLLTWDVTGDGSRFLLPADTAENSVEPFSVVLNWTSLLENK